MKVSVERIRNLCRNKGTNIHQLEKSCNLSQGYIYKMPRHEVSYSRLLVIARNLGVTVDELFEK